MILKLETPMTWMGRRNATKTKKGIEARISFLGLVTVVTVSYFYWTNGLKECKKNADRRNADSSAPRARETSLKVILGVLTRSWVDNSMGRDLFLEGTDKSWLRTDHPLVQPAKLDPSTINSTDPIPTNISGTMRKTTHPKNGRRSF